MAAQRELVRAREQTDIILVPDVGRIGVGQKDRERFASVAQPMPYLEDDLPAFIADGRSARQYPDRARFEVKPGDRAAAVIERIVDESGKMAKRPALRGL